MQVLVSEGKSEYLLISGSISHRNTVISHLGNAVGGRGNSKICFVTFEYPPFLVGGAGVYGKKLTKPLVTLGVEVHIVAANTGLKNTEEVEKGVFVHRVPATHKPLLGFISYSLSSLAAFKELSKDTGGFDLIHGNGVSAFVLGRLAPHIPRVITVHHVLFPLSKNGILFERIKSLTGEGTISARLQRSEAENAKRVIAVSGFTKESLVSRYGINASRIDVIPNGIEVDEFDVSSYERESTRDSLGISNCFVFLSVGRVDDPRKDMVLLLQAYALLRKRVPHTKLLLAGGGYQRRIRSVAHALGIESDLVLLGLVRDSFLRKLYSACDAYVSSSLLEGFGLTILEAMAAGKPVIAPKVGGIPEIVEDRVNGLLFDRRDPVAISNLMQFYYLNRELGNSVGEANKQRAKEQFSWTKAAIKTKTVYESL